MNQVMMFIFLLNIYCHCLYPISEHWHGVIVFRLANPFIRRRSPDDDFSGIVSQILVFNLLMLHDVLCANLACIPAGQSFSLEVKLRRHQRYYFGK
jgi:hypothetical protein